VQTQAGSRLRSARTTACNRRFGQFLFHFGKQQPAPVLLPSPHRLTPVLIMYLIRLVSSPGVEALGVSSPGELAITAVCGVNHVAILGRTNGVSLPLGTMEDPKTRFCCRPEQSGTWAVWDEVDDAPASLGGCLLIGRTWQRAKAACDLLRRIYDNRLEARSRRGSGGKPADDPVGRADDLISSIRKSRALEKAQASRPQRHA